MGFILLLKPCLGILLPIYMYSYPFRCWVFPPNCINSLVGETWGLFIIYFILNLFQLEKVFNLKILGIHYYSCICQLWELFKKLIIACKIQISQCLLYIFCFKKCKDAKGNTFIVHQITTTDSNPIKSILLQTKGTSEHVVCHH